MAELKRNSYLCTNIKDSETGNITTLYLGKFPLVGLINYTTSYDNQRMLLNHIKSLVPIDLAEKLEHSLEKDPDLDKDVFYFKENKTGDDNMFRVLYSKDSDTIYTSTNDFVKYGNKLISKSYFQNILNIINPYGKILEWLVDNYYDYTFYAKDRQPAYWEMLMSITLNQKIAYDMLCEDPREKARLVLDIKKKLNLDSLVSDNDKKSREKFIKKKTERLETTPEMMDIAFGDSICNMFLDTHKYTKKDFKEMNEAVKNDEDAYDDSILKRIEIIEKEIARADDKEKDKLKAELDELLILLESLSPKNKDEVDMDDIYTDLDLDDILKYEGRNI